MKYFLDTEFLEGTQNKWFGETKPTIDLISIGIVAEDGREYYAISKDFNLKEAWNRYDLESGKINPIKARAKGMTYTTFEVMIPKKVYWIRDNILKPIYNELVLHHTSADWYHKNPHLGEKVNDGRWLEFNYKSLKWLISKYGKSNKQIAEEIKEFCKPIEGHIYSVGLDSYEQVNIGRPNTIVPAKYWTETIGKRTAPEFYGYYCDYDWVVFCWLFGKMIDLPKGFPMYCIDLKQEIERLNEELGYNRDDKEKSYKLQEKPNYPKQTNEHNALADAIFCRDLYKFLNTL